MTMFAPGTNQDYANAYNNWWFSGGQGQAPQRSAFGPDSSPAPKPAAAQNHRQGAQPFGGMPRPTAPQSTDMAAYSSGRSAGKRWNGSQWSTPSTARRRPQQPPNASPGFAGGDTTPPAAQSPGGLASDPRRRNMGRRQIRQELLGQAQSIQPSAQGTPYDPQGIAGNNLAATDPSPGQAWQVRGANSPAAKTFLGGQSFPDQFNPQPRSSFSGDSRGGFAAQPADNRPPPFAMGLARTPWGETADPFGERMAMVEQMQNQNMMRQAAFNNGGFAPPPTWGMSPKLDPRRAIGDAGLADGSPTLWW